MITRLEKMPEAATWPLFPQWLSLLERGDLQGMLDFMRSAHDQDRKRVLSLLRKLPNDYFEYDDSRVSALKICRFICFEAKDVAKYRSQLEWMLPGAEIALMILPWYKPDWFGDVYNRIIAESRSWVNYTEDFPYGYFHFGYDQCLACEKLGAIDLAPDALAPRVAAELIQGLRVPGRLDDFLTKHPEVMKRDVWTLFAGEFWNALNPCEFPNWREDFNKFFINKCADGDLDRQRVLKECLSAVGRNLSNNQISLYMPLFAALKPTADEISHLSGELLAVVGSHHGKAAADALKLLKTIAAEKSFPWRQYIGLLPALLALNVKSVQAPALAVAEILVKKNPACRPELAPALTEAFGSPDEALQLRAAKCLLACGPDDKNTELAEELARRGDQMAASVKELLAGLLNKPAEVFTSEPELQTESRAKLDPAALISLPADLDELVFLISSAFVEPADHHASFIPDSLYAFRDQLNDEVLARLTPAVTAARRVAVQTTFNSPVHSRSTAVYFLRWFLGRLAQSTSKDKALSKLKASADEIASVATTNGHVCFKPRFANEYVSWPFPALFYNFLNLGQVIEEAFRRIDAGDSLPMLSSVTHEPFWIDPLILIKRLQDWQKAGREPGGMDIQLAIQRCALENLDEAKPALEDLKGESRLLVEYLFGGPLPPRDQISHPAWWLTAALTRPKRTAPDELLGPDFVDFTTPYFKNSFQWQLEPFTRFDAGQAISFNSDSVMTFNLTRHPIYSRLPESEQIASPPPLTGEAAGLFAGPMLFADDSSFLHQALSLYPNNPDLPLMNYFVSFNGDNSPQSLSVYLKLMELGAAQGPAVSLFTALGFFSDIREIRQTAAAFWRSSAEEGLTNNSRLGADLGLLVDQGWAPIKRLTDLIETEMLNFGPQCARQLAETLEVLLLKVGLEPKSSIKRLMEIYYELVAAGIRLPNQALSPQIIGWGEQKAYEKICRRLSKLIKA